MPLATKNGSLIVKDGKLAEDCGCCGGPCKCDATAVTVSISASNFVRHLFLQNSFGAQSRISLGFIAAPSNGVWVLRKDTVDATAGVSASKWVSDAVPSPGSGRITAVVYRPSETSPARVTVGIPVWYWRSTGSAFKSLDEMIAESNAGGVVAQGFGTLVVELQCDSQSGTSRVLSLRPAIPESQWSPDGSTLPLLACDFTDANGIARTGGSVWWEGERLLKGQERLLSPQFGFSIISDTRTGNNIVTLNSVNLLCCEDEQDGACCEGTTCTVKPQCQCQGTGKTFQGVGTTCASLNGACCEDGPAGSPPTCSIKTSCECVGQGKTFFGVGTTCVTDRCCTKCTRLSWCQSPACIPKFLNFTYSISFPIQFNDVNGGYYIRPFSASGSCTLRGVISSEPSKPCGDYAFFAGPPDGAAFNAYEFGCGVTGAGDYYIRHLCRLVQDGRYDGPYGDRYIYKASTASIAGELSWNFSTYGIMQFTPAVSGYCYQSGVAISSEAPGATATASITGAYGVM